jgi:hypothetical protein
MQLPLDGCIAEALRALICFSIREYSENNSGERCFFLRKAIPGNSSSEGGDERALSSKYK